MLRWTAVLAAVTVLTTSQPTIATGGPSSFEEALDDPVIREQLIQADLHFRRSFHLRADRQWVEFLYADLSQTVGHRRTGALLTWEEYAEIRARDALEDEIPGIEGALRGLSGYAGTYIDNAAGGILTVLVTDAATAMRVPPIQPADRLATKTVAHTLAKLQGTYRAISDAFIARTASTRGITEVSLDIALNVVDVKYRADSPEAEDVAQGRIPPAFARAFDTSAVSIGLLAVEAIPHGLDLDCDAFAPPLRGGHGFSDVSHTCTAGGESFCSIGFEMDKAGVSDTDFILTAGHCFVVEDIPVDAGIWHRSVKFGFAKERVLGPRDAAIIRVPNQNHVYDDVYDAWATVDVAGVVSGNPVGSRRCVTGIVTTFTACGDVIGNSVAYECIFSGVGIVALENHVLVDVATVGGDSGGPLFKELQSTVNAAGITSCGSSITQQTKFQKVTDLPPAWDYSVSTD